MQKTVAGLPNSCSVCGKPLTREDGWYAEHDDAARSGGGMCANCIVLRPAPGEDMQAAINDIAQANTANATSLDDQDADGKPELITHGKRGKAARK